MKTPRIMVTGCSGLLGWHIMRSLYSGYEIAAISRHPGQFDQSIRTISVDITDFDAFQNILQDVAPNIIINSAALSDVDGCEINREIAKKANAEAVGVMAQFCRQRSRLLVHISTDYIFDGKSGPYAESAEPSPINYYGETKLDAEKAVSNSGCDHIIIRTNHLYGILPDGPSKFLRMLRDAGEKKIKIRVASDLYCNPTWAGTVAESINELLDLEFRGVINIGGSEYLSRFELALKASKSMGIDERNIQKASHDDLGMIAPRPRRAGLQTGLMTRLLKTKSLDVIAGLHEALAI